MSKVTFATKPVQGKSADRVNTSITTSDPKHENEVIKNGLNVEPWHLEPRRL